MELDNQIRSETEAKKKYEKTIPRADLQCVIDIKTKSIAFDTNDLFFPDLNLFFGFRDDGKLGVVFDNMSYGWDISELDNDTSFYLTSKEYPGYISTDAIYLQSESVYGLETEKTYGLNVWCKNKGERFSGQCTFRIANVQEYFPKDIKVPMLGEPGYARINVDDPWWV